MQKALRVFHSAGNGNTQQTLLRCQGLHSVGVEGELRLGLANAVHLEADAAKGIDVHNAAAVEDERRLRHAVVNALIV